MSTSAVVAPFSPRADAYNRVDTGGGSRRSGRLDGQSHRVVRLLRLRLRPLLRLRLLPTATDRAAVHGGRRSSPPASCAAVRRLFFGHLADRHGRRNGAHLSVLLMCVGSLLIAVTAHLRHDRRRCPCCCCSRASCRASPGRRIRHQRHLPVGGGASRASWLLLRHPVHHPDRWPVVARSCCCSCCRRCPTRRSCARGAGASPSSSARSWRSTPSGCGRLHETDHFTRPRPIAREKTRLKRCSVRTRARCSWSSASPSAARRRSTPTPPTCRSILKLSVGLPTIRPPWWCCSRSSSPLPANVDGALSDRIGRKPMLVAFGVLGMLLHLSAAGDAAADPQSGRGDPAHLRGVGHRQPVYVDHRDHQGGAVSHQRARARRRIALRRDRLALWQRHRRLDCAVVQERGPRVVVLLVPTACIFLSLLVYLFMPDMKTHSRMEQHA